MQNGSKMIYAKPLYFTICYFGYVFKNKTAYFLAFFLQNVVPLPSKN